MEVEINDSFNRRGNRRIVYCIAATRQAYYTTAEKTDSIRYRGSTLVVQVAFEDKRLARSFVNDLNPLNQYADCTVVKLVAMERYECELDDDDMIYEQHYHSKDYGVPGRIERLRGIFGTGLADFQSRRAAPIHSASGVWTRGRL